MPPFSLDRSSTTADAEVALALCNLGSDVQEPRRYSGETWPSTALSLNKLADAAVLSASFLPDPSRNVVSPPVPQLRFPKPPPLPPHFPGQQLQHVTMTSPPKSKASHSVPIQKASHLDISARRAKKNDPKHRRRSKKEDTSVTFEEMTRLMNTYGPIKCLRNRTNRNADKEIKAASILRKFYRWFPDFEERFVKQSDGRYMPKIGHEKEIQYREMMRGRDEKYVITKRNLRRYSMDAIGDPMNGNIGMHNSY